MGKISEVIESTSGWFHLLNGVSVALFLSTQLIQPIFPLYIKEKGASTFEVGLIISVLSFTAIVSKIPLGILAQWLGKWPVISISLFGQSVSLLLYSLAPNHLWFYPIRVLQALIMAAFSPTAIAIVSDLAPAGKRGDRIGRFLTSFGVATMFGPFFCSLLLEYVNYTQLFQVAATIPFMGLAAFLLATYRGTHFSSSEEKRAREKRKISPLGSLRKIAFSRNVLILSYLRLTFSFTNAFFTTLFALYALESLLLTSSLIAVLFGINGLTNMLFRFPSGKMSDKIGHKTPLILSYSLLALTYLVISEFANFYILSIAMAIYGFAHAVRAVTEWSLLGDSAPPEISGIATAYLSTMFNIGGALGAVTSGTLSLILSTQSIFKLASLIAIPGAFLPLLTKKASPSPT